MINIFQGTSGPRDADIAIVGESWGSEEDRYRQPFVGMSGNELNKILAECGIARKACFATNVVPERPYSNDMWRFFHPTQAARKEGMTPLRGLYPMDNVRRGVDILYEQLAAVKPKIIIGFGNYALWALTDDCFTVKDQEYRKVPTGITSWRGSQLYSRELNIPLLPTFHPAAVMRQWPWRYTLKHDISARVKKVFNDDWSAPNWEFTIRPNFDTVMRTLTSLPMKVAVDIETRNHHITCIGFAWDKLHAICIPFITYGGEHYWSLEEEEAIILALREVLSNPKRYIIGANFLYDAQYLAYFLQFIPHCNADTQILQHCCWPGQPKSLNYVSSLYNHYHCFWKDEGKEWHPTFNDEQHWTYNCRDCVETFEAEAHLQQLVDALGLREQADFQMQQFPLCLEMMLRGTRINKATKNTVGTELALLIDENASYLEHILAPDVYTPQPKKAYWYKSPAQQGEIFYDILGMAEKKSRKTKRRTVDKDAITEIGVKEPILLPITSRISALRTLGIYYKNFAQAQLDPDDRMRCFFDPTGTRTFRWSSYESAFGSGTDLQNIPAGTEEED